MEQIYLLNFQKTGCARFLSHLDTARLFVRAFRRAKLPLKFSEGFHAHPKVRFSPPLSVGVESLCEECIFTLLDETRNEETLLATLSDGMADGFVLNSLTRIDRKPDSAPYTRYEISFHATREELCAAFAPPMTVTKRTKSQEKELDIYPHLHAEDIREENGLCILQVLSPSSESLTINPTLICTALKAKNEALIPVRILKVATVER